MQETIRDELGDARWETERIVFFQQTSSVVLRLTPRALCCRLLRRLVDANSFVFQIADRAPPVLTSVIVSVHKTLLYV